MTGRIDGRTLRFEHRRGEVLQAATEHALDHGLSDLSLRSVARTVGVSHATLVHHFGSKDQLVAEIVDNVLAGALAAPEIDDGDPDPLHALWVTATSDRGRRSIRLFIAITGQAMHGSPQLRTAVARSIRQRIELLADQLVRHGCPEAEAPALATELLATLRGLITDLSVTEDRDRIEAAFEQLRADLDQRRQRWGVRYRTTHARPRRGPTVS